MADKEPVRWITVNGKHIPIYEGENNADALDRAFGKKNVKVGDKEVTVSKDNLNGKIKEAFDYAKGKIDKESYSWKETVMDAEYEYKLTPAETRELETRMKLYAMTHDKFKGMHEEWEKDFKSKGFDYKQAMQSKKGLIETHKPEELLKGQNNYTEKAEYKIKSDWLREHSKQYNEDKKEWLELYRKYEDARDKYIDPEDKKELGKSLARTLVNDDEHPELIEMREKLNTLDKRNKEFEQRRSEYNDYFESIDKSHSKIQRAAYGRPQFEDAYGSYLGFKTDDTGVSYYNDLLSRGKAKIVEMTPEQYLHEIAHYIFTDSTYQKALRGAIDDPETLKYAKMMREGTKFDTPYLNYTDEAQEGRHRAIAAYINGIEKIPVVIVGRRR